MRKFAFFAIVLSVILGALNVPTVSASVGTAAFCGPEDHFVYAVPSPDGTKLAVLSWDTDYYEDTNRSFYSKSNSNNFYGVLLVDLTTGETYELTGDSVSGNPPLWLDSETIGYFQNRYDEVPWYQVTVINEKGDTYYTSSNHRFNQYLMAYSLRTGEIKQVTMATGRVIVQKDPNLIAFRRSGSSQVWLRNLELGIEWSVGTQESQYTMDPSSVEWSVYERIVDPSTNLVFENPDFSPSGKIVIQVSDPKDTHLAPVVPSWLATDKGPIFSKNGEWRDVNPYWIDDNTIVFVSDRQKDETTSWKARTLDAFIMNADGSELHQITCPSRYGN